MNYHEKTIELIETLGIKPKKIAEILGAAVLVALLFFEINDKDE